MCTRAEPQPSRVLWKLGVKVREVTRSNILTYIHVHKTSED